MEVRNSNKLRYLRFCLSRGGCPPAFFMGLVSDAEKYPCSCADFRADTRVLVPVVKMGDALVLQGY